MNTPGRPPIEPAMIKHAKGESTKVKLCERTKQSLHQLDNGWQQHESIRCCGRGLSSSSASTASILQRDKIDVKHLQKASCNEGRKKRE